MLGIGISCEGYYGQKALGINAGLQVLLWENVWRFRDGDELYGTGKGLATTRCLDETRVGIEGGRKDVTVEACGG